jgi:hypothetical protein
MNKKKRHKMNSKLLLRGWITLIYLFIFCTYSYCQANQKNPWDFKADAHFGFVIPEYQHFNYLVEKPVQGIELSLHKASRGRNFWEQLYRYPEFGFSLFASSLGNNEVFGHEIALYPYIQTPLIRKDKFQFSTTFGFGAGYATKKFDLVNNYQNVSVGSHFNIHFKLKLSTHYDISPLFRINAGLSFIHFSNANMAEPNLGVNLFTAHAGINYRIRERLPYIEHELKAYEPKHEFAFIYALGGKHTRALQTDVYFTSSISTEYKYHFKRKFHFGVGLDLFYDSSTETEMSANGLTNHKNADDFRTGIHLSQEVVFERFSFILQEGFYIGLVDEVNGKPIYYRGILRWKINPNWMVSISMKSHLHILDYPELGFGYYFIRKKS